MKTLLLDQSEWDLVLDASGDIAIADAPYAVAQDVASAVRVFAGELWYDTSQGIPYRPEVLGNTPSLQYLKSKIEAAALTVPTVAKARCLFASLNDRVLTGQIQIIDDNGVESNVSF
jgi:hypothetical protein